MLLFGLHAGDRDDWDFRDLRRGSSRCLRNKSLGRVNELFEGKLLKDARAVVKAAYVALDRRHVAMHSLWILTGPGAITPAVEVISALESSDPDSALTDLRFRLASALYAGKPLGARQVVRPDTGERLA